MSNSDIIRSNWSLKEVNNIYALPFNDLIFKASKVHRQFFDPNKVQVSTLLSIKTGSCPEDCKYCPQSAHYQTKITKEELLPIEKITQAAKKAKEAGATRFCMGAAWRQLNNREIDGIKEMIQAVKALGLETCVTLGMLDKNQAVELKNAGLDYYNHNVDSSKRVYEKVITTRNYEDRLNTIKNVQDANINVCSGGIVGIGDTQEDRAQMLHLLANMNPHPGSVPINMLVKMEGTPLFDEPPVDIIDFVKTIAVARILMPKSYVRLSAGRQSMSDEAQSLCFLAGANSIFYGDKLLTTDNPEIEQDQKLFDKLGIEFEKAEKLRMAG
ncbi:MAG: biotin synthase BioB [Pseudomonadota bacterium]